MADAPAADNDDHETGSQNGEIAVQNRRSTASSVAGTGGGGGGREDCWSEGATAVLIEAWGERYVALSRGSLKQKHWEEVAEIVAARAGEGKAPKTHVQCKYRIDTVKKKYKSEKAKLATAGDGRTSNWRFFDRVDQLLGSPNAVIPVGIPVHQPPPSKSPRKRKRPVKLDSGSEADDISPGSSDSLPPMPANQDERRGRKQRQRSPPRPATRFDGAGKSVRELTKAIVKFGEAYEKTERAKLKQMVEMEMQRMKFAKEIEVQRMKFLVKTQVEISQISRVGGGRMRGVAGGGGGGGGGDSNHRHINDVDESNVNNSNSSD